MKMTMSLLGSFAWLKTCPPSWKDRALDAFKETLKGGFTGNAATQRGEAYETQVNLKLRSGERFSGIEEPLNALKGMKAQEWIVPFNVNVRYKNKDMTFTFRGKMDYFGVPAETILPGWKKDDLVIIDLKTTGSAIKADRYLDSVQHDVYCLAGGIEKFAYIVCKFDDDVSLTPSDIQVIPTVVDHDKALEGLKEKILELVDYLHSVNLWGAYFNEFNRGQP